MTLFISQSTWSQTKRADFQFEYDSLTYHGLIESPDQAPKGLIVLIPGHGSTDFVNGEDYQELIQLFSKEGFAVCAWDKVGCGKSEGTYNHNQSIESSAAEALAAIAQLRVMKVAGSDQIGLWGISRAGWICPLIIDQDPSIAFWISVSGTDQFENSRYLLEANLRAEKRDEAQIDLLMYEWDHYQKILVRGGESLSDFQDSISNLIQDPFFNPNNFQFTEEIFVNVQNAFQKSGMVHDQQTNLAIMVANFEEVLSRIDIPVLAILGEKDSQVDWRKTRSLYKQTIGANPKAALTVQTFPNGNHTIQKCETGGIYEDLEPFDNAFCEGYHDSMVSWLNGVVGKKRK